MIKLLISRRTHLSLQAILVFSLYTNCYAGVPFAPQNVSSYSQNKQLGDGSGVIKLSIASDELNADSGVAIGNVTLCSESACFRLPLHNQANLYNTSTGKSEVLGEVLVPITTIRSVHFEDLAGSKIVEGDIELHNPLELEADLKRGEILIIVKQNQKTGRVVYTPVLAASNYYSPISEAVYYNPKFSTNATLQSGIDIKIPAKATLDPQILSITAHDVGTQFPLVDIYPIVEFSREISITVNPTGRATASLGTPPNLINHANNIPTTKTINKTGVVRFESSLAPSIPADKTYANSVSAATSAGSCASLLSGINIDSVIGTTGTVLIRACETVAPYVHIVVTNNSDARELFQLTYELSNNSAGSRVNLRNITDWAASNQVLINGFTWAGDPGTGPGTGLAQGFVQQNLVSLGNNRAGGGYFGIGSTDDANKLAVLLYPRTLADWKEGTTPPLWTSPSIYYPEFIIISSSTSVVKSGTCASDSLTNRWSAFGTTPSGRVILVSSTSSGTTNAAELCSVFQALGSNYAIRLDGGPSASMVVDGILLNPLAGLDNFRYGASRHIAYAVSVGYTSGIPGRTPVLTNNFVPPPGNPCSSNPRPPSCS